MSGLTSNSSFAWTEYAVIEHNTILVRDASTIYDGVTVGSKPGTVLSLKSNIFYRTGGPPSDQFAFSNQEPAPHTDVVRAANADYNGWFNLGTVPAGKWNGIADGTVYSTPMSGSTPPGVHDKANIDPKFSDPTRNLQTWDAALGGPGTIASALDRIRQDLTLTKSSLLPYIRNGFRPTNPAYKGTAHDGGDIGAVSVAVPASAGEQPGSGRRPAPGGRASRRGAISGHAKSSGESAGGTSIQHGSSGSRKRACLECRRQYQAADREPGGGGRLHRDRTGLG